MASPHLMTGKERVEAAFLGLPVDQVPVCHIGISSGPASDLLGREAYVGGGIQQWREAAALWNGPDAHAEFVERSYRDAIDIALLLGNDILRPTYWRYVRKPTRRLDDCTFVYENGSSESDWMMLVYDPSSEQALIKPCRPRPQPDFDALESGIEAAERAMETYHPEEVTDGFALRAKAEYGDRFVIRTGPVAVGIPHDAVWLEALALRPDLVARHLDVAVERALRDLAVYAHAGFRYFFGGYDFAAKDGPLFSPRVFAELLAPRLRRISAECEYHGAFHLFASDGCLWPVAESLFAPGVIHGYYEIDRSAGMDLRRLRGIAPTMALIGNIASQTLHRGSRAAVVAETLDCLDAAKQLGQIIVGVSNYIVPGTPADNVVAMVETIRTQR